jgi:ankyrin repeat protein
MQEEIKAALTEVPSLRRAVNRQNLLTVLARHENILHFRLIILLSSSIILNAKAFNDVCRKKLIDGKKINGGLTKDEQAILAVVKNQIAAQDGIKNLAVAVEHDQADVISSLNPDILNNPEIANLMLINTLGSGMWNISSAMLNKATSLDYQDVDGNTALHALAMTNDIDEQKINEFLKLVEHKYASQVLSLVGLSNNGGATALHFAAINNNAEMVRWLIENGADISQRNNEGQTALDVAVRNKNTEMVLAILQAYEKKGILNESTVTYIEQTLYEDTHGNIYKNVKEIPIIHWAISKRKSEVAKYLVDKFSTDNELATYKINGQNHVIIQLAAKMGMLDFIKYLFDKKGAGINDIDTNNRTVLHYAALSGNLDLVQYLVEEKGADISASSRDSITPLHYAAHSGNLDLVRYLVDEKGADISASSRDSITPLHYAAESGSLDLVRYLVDEKDSNINDIDTNGQTVLYHALESGRVDLVRYLVDEKGLSINIPDRNGETVLHYAAESGSLDLVRYLVDEKGLSINDIDTNDKAVLHYAAHSGNLELVRYLVDEKGLSINTLDRYNHTELLYAASSGSLDLVRYLVDEKGLSINAPYRNARTALYNAVGSGSLDLVWYLVEEKGANINAESNYKTALHRAAESGSLDLVRYLIAQGANINNPDSYNKTVLDYAVMTSRIKVVELLLEYNAKIGEAISYNLAIAQLLEAAKNPDQLLLSGAKEGSLIKVKIALGRGADLEHKDSTGKTALELSRQSNNTDITELLEKTIKCQQYLEVLFLHISTKQGITEVGAKILAKYYLNIGPNFLKKESLEASLARSILKVAKVRAWNQNDVNIAIKEASFTFTYRLILVTDKTEGVVRSMAAKIPKKHEASISSARFTDRVTEERELRVGEMIRRDR